MGKTNFAQGTAVPKMHQPTKWTVSQAVQAPSIQASPAEHLRGGESQSQLKA